VIYLSGPLTARNGRTLAQHVGAARAVYLRFVRAGVPVYCPHLGADHPDALSISYEQWMAYDLAVLEQCRGVLTLPHWRDSPGSILEVAHAIAHGVPVYHDEAAARAFGGVIRGKLTNPACSR
jgi:hypothetical protein